MKEEDWATHLKDRIMLWQWRFMSIQGFIAPIFYISTISLLIYPYALIHLDKVAAELLWTFGLDRSYLGLTILIMVYGIMGLGMMTVAYFWDKKAEMWKSAQRTAVKRSQYAGQDVLTPKEIFMMERIWLPVMKELEIDTTDVEEWIHENRK